MNSKNRINTILGVTGLSTSFHDNSAALIRNGKVLFAASEERYTRIKHDKSFPINSIKEALRFTKTSKKDVDLIAIGYPKRYFFQPFLGQDLVDLIKALWFWIRGRKIYFIFDCLKILKGEFIQNEKGKKAKKFLTNKKLVYVGHHLSHAASAYFTAGYKKALAVCMDAFGPKENGELISGSVYVCDENLVGECQEEIKVNSSIGLFYTSITQALGFTPGDGEGKTMGLAAYGNPALVYKPLRKIAPVFKRGKWDKSPLWVEMFFSLRKEFRPIFESLPIGKLLNKLIKKHGKEQVAAAAQLILEEEAVKYFEYLVSKYKTPNLVLAGGLFLNVKMNMKISQIKGVRDVFVHPNAGDGGTALGAALELYSEKVGFKKLPPQIKDVSWGTGYSTSEIERAIKAQGKRIVYGKQRDITKLVAKKLLEGKVIGWFQGRFEWGPRALGYRSVLIDPRRMDIKEKLNNTLKNREWFMPFAPSILVEYGEEYFENFKESPFMTMAFDVKKGKVKDIEAAIHIDKTGRPNSVSKSSNALYYRLIREFQKLTGIPVILNTSFNKHGLPIVNSPEDAIKHLLWNCIDELVLGNYIVTRRNG